MMMLMMMTSNSFLTAIERRFHSMKRYEDKNVQCKALNLIPVLLLEQRAQERMRMLQKQVKKGEMEDPNISIQEMLLLELLAWFKDSFFEWVDSPECDYCFSETKYSHMSQDPKLLVDTDRVEMHRCVECGQFTPFSRYNNLDTLLETREGRCGEWATVFTLMCIALGWDARFVFDETDHVWTEVYSAAQKRWLHCDPCENICDNPLIYETGWGKKLSYIIACSLDDIQDVSWRYSASHSKLLENRTVCSESDLVDTIIRLRNARFRQLSPARRMYLTRRTLLELVELMVEKKPTDADKIGRTSGSLDWRLKRGETKVVQKIWSPSNIDLSVGQMTIRYSSTSNQYERISSLGAIVETLSNWENGVFKAEHVFRKVENDWKVVYLCREETAQEGEVQWKFDTERSGKLIDKVSVKFESNVFENGDVDVQIRGADKYVFLSRGCPEITTGEFSGCGSITITARLRGGKGDCSWQHAQLFRQPLDCPNYPFSVTITF